MTNIENREYTVPKVPIVVGACTFRRPDDLNNLLKSIALLSVPSGLDIRVVIIDNDTWPSARDVVTLAQRWMPFPLLYVYEPTPGIPFARNRALKESGETGFLAFVDDDETVDPHWLDRLLNAQYQTGATFIQGPVIMSVSRPVDEWWLNTTFFAQKISADFTSISESWTNNVLIDLSFVHSKNIKFEEELQFEGGEDTLFFQDVVSHGGKGFFTTQALVFETQNSDRLNWRWGLHRQYRYGITRAKTAILRRSLPTAFGYCLFRGSAMILIGIAKFPTALIIGKLGIANSLALIARGAGVFAGFFGQSMDEYRA